MRTEIESLPWTQAIKKYAPDRIVACHIQGFEGFYNHQNNTHQGDLQVAWTLTIQDFERKQFGNHCECVIFTEEVPAEIQAKLDAMPPMERLAHQVRQCKKQEKQIITSEYCSEYLEAYPLKNKCLLTSITKAQVAQLLLSNSEILKLLTAEERLAFENAINVVQAKLKSLESVNPENQKLTSAILGNL